MVEWTLTRDQSVVEENLYDIQYVDSANTFGDYLIAKIDDINGTKFDEYPRGTRVDASVTPTDSTTAIDKFSGYVVERREVDQGGADALEIEAYTFDQFLRNNTVSTDLSGQTIDTALQTIVENDTPVSFDANKITVGDNQELTRSFRGVKVEEALIDLAFKSESEDFGVDANLDFFFRPEETEHIDRGVDDTNWFNYDIPERGKEAINEVEVWYDGGDESVIVDNGQDKLDLQESLGLNAPGTQRAEITRERIIDLGDAEDEGRKYLQLRNSTLTGEITTFGLYNAEPGDTINVSISTRGIDTEFRIAEVDYRWADDQTILTIVEKRGDNDDVLLRLTDAVDRVEMREANRDAPKNRITTTEAIGLIETSATATVRFEQEATTIGSGETTALLSGESIESEVWRNAGTFQNAGTVIEPGDETGTRLPSADRFVNEGRNYIRDVWSGNSIDPIDTLVIGTDNAGISRSNSDLKSQIASVSVSTSLIGDTGVEFTASGFDVVGKEIGLKTASGRLVYRAVFDQERTFSEATITLTVSDNSISRSVLTTGGQTSIRDVIADNNPDLPDEYGYGTGDTLPTESDTDLETPAVFQDLDDVLLEEFALSSDFEEFIEPIPDDVPLGFTGEGELTQLQTTQFEEAEESPGDGTIESSNLPGDYSSFDAVVFDGVGQATFFTFTFDYRVPAGEAVADFYCGFDEFDGTVTIRVNDAEERTITFSGATSDNSLNSTGVLDSEFQPNETISLQFEITDYTSGKFILDTAQIYDRLTRFDNINTERIGTVDTSTSSNILTAPDLYPELQEFDVPVVNTRRLFQEARIRTEYDNTDNFQFVELSNDGTNFTRGDNTENLTVSFGSASRELYARFGLSHYESVTVESPRKDASQKLDSIQLYADVDATVTEDIGETLTRAIINGDDVLNETITEAGLFGNNTLLTRHVIAPFTVEDSATQLLSSEVTRFTGEDS